MDMESLTIIGEILKYLAPAAIVLLAVKFMSDTGVERERVTQNLMIRNEILKQHLPLKITAYERATLFLERISPENLLPRLNASGKTVSEFRMELIQEIREEFEHNMAQQIYISNPGWMSLIRAKEEILNVINEAARELDEDEEGLFLAKRIIEKMMAMEELPAQRAIIILKNDLQPFFKIS
ncbi:MAG: hypothetical protein AAF388_24855 [Bacteroidota bacterium]